MLPCVKRRAGLAVSLAVLVVLAGCATTTVDARVPAAGNGAVATSTASARAAQTEPYADLAPAEPTTSLPTITVAKLPPEGVETLELIEAGGPFPYEQDGATFGNREGILPTQPKGFYAEYTVVTPGSDDRGARRIVAGDDGSRFYTVDHYASFREVVSG